MKAAENAPLGFPVVRATANAFKKLEELSNE